MKNALQKGILSDVNWIVRGEVIAAHKLFLQIQSQYFLTACSRAKCESSGPVTLDLDPHIFRPLLLNIYTDSVNFFKTNSRELHHGWLPNHEKFNVKNIIEHCLSNWTWPEAFDLSSLANSRVSEDGTVDFIKMNIRKSTTYSRETHRK